MRGFGCVFFATSLAEDSLNLLQLASGKFSHVVDSGATHYNDVGKQCPAKPANKFFGCRDGDVWNYMDPMSNPSARCPGYNNNPKGTRQCAWGNKGLVQSVFGTSSKDGGFKWVDRQYTKEAEYVGWMLNHSGPYVTLGEHYKTGLFRMARAKDNSWEAQFFNCGVYKSGAVVRFGNTTIEVFVNPSDGQWAKPTFVVNGAKVKHDDLPGDMPGGVFLGPKNRVFWGGYNRETSWGSCADDPNGQIRVEWSYVPSYLHWKATHFGIRGFLQMLIEVKEDSYVDGPDEEKISTCPGLNFQMAEPLHPSESLFTDPSRLCPSCSLSWRTADSAGVNGGHVASWFPMMRTEDGKIQKKDQGNYPAGLVQDRPTGAAAKAQCEAVTNSKKPARADQKCSENGVSMDEAKDACKDQTQPLLFESCVFDFCTKSVKDAGAGKGEEKSLSQPKCLRESVACNPQAICCDDDAVKGLNFGNVVQNNLDGSDAGERELRFGEVKDGVDLLITCPDYANHRKNRVNGARGAFGTINVQPGKSHNLTFTFVEKGSTNPVSPGNAVISFIDLDQGKSSKQRESVKVCGLDPLVTTNSELEISSSDSCVVATSTTRGTGKDNPGDPASMNDLQRARTIAFPLNGQSTFNVELGVTAKGGPAHGRPFLFTGHPTVACEQ